MNHDTPRIQQQGREIQIKGEESSWAIKPCKGEGKARRKKIEIKEGQVFGRLTALRPHDDTGRRRKWVFMCVCGNEKIARISHVSSGVSSSCGCLNKELSGKRVFVHGLSFTKEHRAWSSAKSRCQNPNDAGYPMYGGRGITFDPRWEDFLGFLADMGNAPSTELSLDRIEVNGNYCKENCRWATEEVQANNKTTSRYLEYGGEKLTIAQWSRRIGLSQGTLRARIEAGWSSEQVLNKPLRVWESQIH